MNSATAIEIAKATYPRLPWTGGATVTSLGGRVFVFVGRHTVAIKDGKVESKTYRKTSGTSRKECKGF